MQKLKSVLIGMSLGLSSCTESKTIDLYSTFRENAVVSETLYQPANKASGLGVGITGGGDLAVTSNSLDTPEKYSVVFQTSHGKFIYEGTEEQHKNLWSRLNRGDSVEMIFNDNYREVWKDTNGDGKRELMQKIFINREFKDARVKRKAR